MIIPYLSSEDLCRWLKMDVVIEKEEGFIMIPCRSKEQKFMMIACGPSILSSKTERIIIYEPKQELAVWVIIFVDRKINK